VGEDERHGLQFRESARLRDDPWNKSRFNILLDSHEAIMRSGFREGIGDSVLELRRCTSLVRAT